MTIANQTKTLQNRGKTCITARNRIIKRTILFVSTFVICAAAVVFSYVKFQPAIITHPDFDAAAIIGQPEVGEEYGYSTLTVRDGYRVQLCGAPAVNGQKVSFFLTNPKGNDIWLRAVVLGEDNEILASSGVLRQGEYLPELNMEQPLEKRSTPVTVKIISYVPNTWQSAGNINLQLNLYSP